MHWLQLNPIIRLFPLDYRDMSNRLKAAFIYSLIPLIWSDLNRSLPPPWDRPLLPLGSWWCCSHWPLEPMLGTWWQRHKSLSMDLPMGWVFSKAGRNREPPLHVIETVPVRPEPEEKSRGDSASLPLFLFLSLSLSCGKPSALCKANPIKRLSSPL